MFLTGYTIKDLEKFNLIRKMWDLMLTGRYSPPQILEIANKEWGFRTRKYKKFGGGELTKSGIYKLFNNIFYAGTIEFGGKQYKGSYEPIITLEEFDRVQAILGRKGKPRPQKHKFAFTGTIKCQDCDCYYTAETKKKFIKCDQKLRYYTYYRCTCRKTYITCPQKGVVREEEIKKQLGKEVYEYTILPQFKDWAIEILDEETKAEAIDKQTISLSREKAHKQSEEELSELTRMRYRKLIDDGSFLKEKSLLEAKINQLNQNLDAKDNQVDQELELTKEKFNFAVYAHRKLLFGDLDEQKEVVITLFSSIKAKNRQLTLEPYEWFIPIKNGYPALRAEYLELEPVKNRFNKEQTEALASIRSHWSGCRESNSVYIHPMDAYYRHTPARFLRKVF